MIPLNNFMEIKPIERAMGVIDEGHQSFEWEIAAVTPGSLNFAGDYVIVDPERVTCVSVRGQQRYYVKEDDVFAYRPKNESATDD